MERVRSGKIGNMKYSQNTVGVPSELADWANTECEQVMQQMRAGTIIVPGSQMAGWGPQVQATVPPFIYRPDPVVQKMIYDLLQRGIRT